MSARGRGQPRRRRAPKTRAQKVLTNYDLTAENIEFNALGAGAEIQGTLFDNSGIAQNLPVRLVKIKTSYLWDRNMTDERVLLKAIYRQTQGATPLPLDDEDTVKNATQAGQFYRRPYRTHTNIVNYGTGGEMDHMAKPTILTNVLLDNDDDLVVGFTNDDAAFAASSQLLKLRTEVWWKRV